MSEQGRAELIPADLAPRITRMVVDDLRAAGWTVEPPARTPKIVKTEWRNVPRFSDGNEPGVVLDPRIWTEAEPTEKRCSVCTKTLRDVGVCPDPFCRFWPSGSE